MTLTKSTFKVLNALRDEAVHTQRHIATATGLSLGTVNTAYRALVDAGLAENFSVTPAGFEALSPYKVDNAIIMAAGLSSRFAPLSYEKPKGVLTVRGEVLIERQIRQLREAGITDITVVVGYMKEAFFYLEDKFGVTIRVNAEYSVRNNNSTLMLVREKLGNTYVCSSDDYFTENVFEPYVFEAYYPGVFFAGETNEYLLDTARDGRITGVTIGGRDKYGMLGHVYFDRAFSETFVRILVDEYDRPETAGKLWFDHDFIENVDSAILDNICRVLDCSRGDVEGIVPIKEGLTNLSFRFVVRGESYVYRHPGVGTDEIINRASEAFSQAIAKKLGIDDTFIHEDPAEGWKISRFIDGCVPFDYHNEDHVRHAMELGRRLHDSGERSEWSFDVYRDAVAIVELLGRKSYPSFPDREELGRNAGVLDAFVRADRVEPCLCHNDFYSPNFLVRGEEMYLIDWEYSAMSDYASDLGTFICCSDYSVDEARHVIELYFGRTPTDAEMRHCLAYVALAAYYWFVWALYKESTGDPVGEWLYLWYRTAKEYSALALKLYGATPGQVA